MGTVMRGGASRSVTAEVIGCVEYVFHVVATCSDYRTETISVV